TFRSLSLTNALRISSATPSEKYSWSRAGDRSTNGNTAMDLWGISTGASTFDATAAPVAIGAGDSALSPCRISRQMLSKFQTRTSAIGKPIAQAIRNARVAQSGRSSAGVNCEMPCDRAQVAATYTTPARSTLRRFNSEKKIRRSATARDALAGNTPASGHGVSALAGPVASAAAP